MAYDPIVNGVYIVKLVAEGEVGAGVEYACQTSEVTITPKAGDTVRFDSLGGPGCSFVSVKPTEWSMVLHYAQDYADGNLARWLYDNDGAKFAGEINPTGGPASATEPSFTVSGRVVAGPIGGGVKGEYAEGEVDLPLDGKPELVETPPTLVAPTVAAAAAPANGSTSSSSSKAAA